MALTTGEGFRKNVRCVVRRVMSQVVPGTMWRGAVGMSRGVQSEYHDSRIPQVLARLRCVENAMGLEARSVRPLRPDADSSPIAIAAPANTERVNDSETAASRI